MGPRHPPRHFAHLIVGHCETFSLIWEEWGEVPYLVHKGGAGTQQGGEGADGNNIGAAKQAISTRGEGGDGK